MSIFSENLRHLRNQKGYSQKKLAEELIITRVRLAKYEEGISEPPFDILKRLSAYFHVSIDILISVNLQKFPMDSLLKMEDNRILLPVTIDKTGRDYIEIIPHKAKAGYLSGYSDPEYVEKLQQMHLPFIRQGKHRAFPIEGDSMPPHKEGSFIVGRYIEKAADIKDGRTYVVLSRNEGIVYKRLFRKNKKEQSFMLHSDNSFYKPYEVKTGDLLEVWEHVCSFCTKEFEPDDLDTQSMKEMLQQIRKDIRKISAPACPPGRTCPPGRIRQ
ncbi:MAG: LexA family transcriptional regulator [Chitinophagaceae bacterium]|nr:LexA family transcriptional regulator [Chitinophagaceae bacterium]